MDELIRDPLWTFVGVILALLAVVVTISIYFAQRKKKGLSYDVISNTQLLGVKDEIQGKVKVLYEGNEVKGTSKNPLSGQALIYSSKTKPSVRSR